MKHLNFIAAVLTYMAVLAIYPATSLAQGTRPGVIDEVIWVVGDDAILLSDIEKMRTSGERINGNPYCVIPEQLAVQKLYLHQAALDSINVPDEQVNQYVEMQIQEWTMAAGSAEKLEEYRGMTMAQIKEELFDQLKSYQIVRNERQHLTEHIKVTPSDVRQFFKTVKEDSLPLIPTQVEVELLAERPRISQEELDRVKGDLRDYTERINKGETSFSTLAILYSEDPGTARQGGEMPFMGRGTLDPAFANVAWSLQDTKKVSKIVESEFGFHIIQLIERRGDKLKLRHILKRPQVDQKDIDASLLRLDSIAQDIRENKFTFEDAATTLSEDKDSRMNRGLMTNLLRDDNGDVYDRTSRFKMGELPTEIARVVEGLDVGEISKPFVMTDPRSGKTQCCLVKLRARIKQHYASITEDFQVLKEIVENHKKQEFLDNWIREKQKSTYIRINPEWKLDCDFIYPGWIKE